MGPPSSTAPATRAGARRSVEWLAGSAKPGGAYLAILRPVAASQERVPRSHPLLLPALFVGAALLSGFTMLRWNAPYDEGVVLQAARRVVGGEVPYRDFIWPYGPAHPYLLGGIFELTGTSLLPWRILRVLCDSAVALAVFALVRPYAGTRLALVGWLTAACAMAQPSSASPFPFALLLALLSLLAVARRQTAGRLVLAGAFTALAAAWRLDFALYAGAAVVVALALAPGSGAERLRRVGIYAATAVLGGLLVYGPFIALAGTHDVYDNLVGRSFRDRDWWTLPFPISYHGSLAAWPPGTASEDVKHLLGFYVPLLSLVAAALATVATLVAWRERAPARALSVAMLVLGAGLASYLLSRTDEFHAAPLIVTAAVVVPLALRASRGRRLLTGGLAALLALLLVYGLANRLSALLRPPKLDSLDVPVADGVKAPPREAAALEQVVRTVQARVPEGQPIYMVTRRSDLVRYDQPLVYVLTERDNASGEDLGLRATPAAQRRIVAALARTRPRMVVRWTDPSTVVREPNLRGRPTGSRALDRWIAAHYRLLETAGDYQLLVPRV
jgi:hypothetical protein